MKIHRQIVATGDEWKPCCECGQEFEKDTILTAMDTESNAGVLYWFCERCTDLYFGRLKEVAFRRTWKIHTADGRCERVNGNSAA